MLTYKKVIEENRLLIRYDDQAETPRNFNKLGWLITSSYDYISPDTHMEYINLIRNTYRIAKSLNKYHQLIIESLDNPLYVIPIVRYDYNGIIEFKIDWGNSPSGFYIITQKDVDNYKHEIENLTGEVVIEIIENELELYNLWLNDEVFKYTLFDENGEFQDACGGFYDIEEIREHLPEEFHNEDLEDYLIY